MNSIKINPDGRKTYLTRVKEALIIAEAEMDDSHSVGVTRTQLGKHLCSTTE